MLCVDLMSLYGVSGILLVSLSPGSKKLRLQWMNTWVSEGVSHQVSESVNPGKMREGGRKRGSVGIRGCVNEYSEKKGGRERQSE